MSPNYEVLTDLEAMCFSLFSAFDLCRGSKCAGFTLLSTCYLFFEFKYTFQSQFLKCGSSYLLKRFIELLIWAGLWCVFVVVGPFQSI